MPNGLDTSDLTSSHTINSLGLSGGCEQTQASTSVTGKTIEEVWRKLEEDA